MEPVFSYPNLNTRLNRKFAEYLDGKTVAIVGRAGIHEMRQGEIIDSHDVVVRVHYMVPYNPSDDVHPDNVTSPLNDPVKVGEMVPEDWQPIIGRRVNVLYHRLRRPNPKFWETFPTIFEEAGGRFLCNDSTGTQEHWIDACPQAYMPVRYVSWELTSALRLEMQQNPLAGTVCIADILSHNIKSAYITGFLCHFDEEFPHYNLPLYKRKENGRYKWKLIPMHPDLRFLARMNKDERVTVDSNMQFLFNKHCADV